MSDGFDIDYNAIVLEEGIPLNEGELKNSQKELAMLRKLPPLVALLVLPVMAFICWLLRDNFASFKYYDYLLLLGATVISYFFVFLIGKLIGWYDTRNLKKDMIYGKACITSVLTGCDRTEYGVYFTFQGKERKKKIRIQVAEEQYRLYVKGDWLVAEYLPFSKKALLINRAEKD